YDCKCYCFCDHSSPSDIYTLSLHDALPILTVDKVFLSVGRKANTDDIGLENTNIKLEHGNIQTNEYFQTEESHIYAVGDCIGGLDRKSTRLNSSHVSISYAVFCLKKKKQVK